MVRVADLFCRIRGVIPHVADGELACRGGSREQHDHSRAKRQLDRLPVSLSVLCQPAGMGSHVNEGASRTRRSGARGQTSGAIAKLARSGGVELRSHAHDVAHVHRERLGSE